MQLKPTVLILLIFGINYIYGQLVGPGPVTKTSSIAGHCRTTLDGGPASLEGAIWIGWDNLINEPMGPIFDITYDECRMTPDDKYLLPDGMVSLNIKKIHLDRSASFYADFQSYVHDNTESINLDVSASGSGDFGQVSISGSYSQTHQEIKKNFQTETSTMMLTKLNYHAYDLPNQLGEKLHPEFMAQLLEINDAIQSNLTRKAQYLSQLLTRNYGTHVITQAKVGAHISQEDYMKKDESYESDFLSNLDSIKVSASYSFFSMFSFGMSFSDDKSSSSTNSSKYESFKRYNKVRTTGGPDVNSLLSASFSPTADSPSVALVNDVVPIDRAGIPIFAIINDQYFPEYVSVDTLRSHIFNATAEYYKRNTVYGCTNSSASNFNFQANVDDNNCIAPPTSYTGFGGFIQRCWPVSSSDGYLAPDTVCDKYRQPNLLTGSDSCQTDLFEEETLFDDTIVLDCQSETVNIQQCHSCGFLDLETCCQVVPVKKTVCNTVHIQTSWCRPQQNVNLTNIGLLFGGLFLDGHVNPYTKTAGCAGSTEFMKTRLGVDLNLCLSINRDDEGYAHTLSSMFSCRSTTKTCSKGTSMHFATKINECDIFYCSPTPPPQYQSYTSRPLLRPPYLPASALINDTQSSVKIYSNDTLLIEKLLQEVIEEMYILMIESLEKGVTNTDLIPFSMSDLVAQWASGMIGKFIGQNQNDTTAEPSMGE